MGIVGKNIYNFFDEEASFSYDVFDSLKFGDLIIAKRYNTELQKQKIEPGHEVGPYVVLGRSEKGNLLCFKASSVCPKDYIGKNSVFALKIIDPTFMNIINKDTYVRTTRVVEVSRDRFLIKVYSFNEFLLKKLKKRIALNRELDIIKNADRVKKYDVQIEAGDIIEKSGLWYLILYFDENNEALCLPLLRKNTNETINIGERSFNVDFNRIVKLKSIASVKRVGFVDNDKQLEALLAKIRKYLKYKAEYYTIKRGSLIEFEGLLYFIYGEEGNAWLAHQVWRENINSRLEKIVINQEYYYLDFKKFACLEKDIAKYKIVALASEREIDYYKKLKKYNLSKRSRKDKKKKTLTKSFIKIGSYVRRFFNGEYYLVVWRNNDIVVVVDENDIYTKKYNFKKFSITDVSRCDKDDYEEIHEILDDIRGLLPEFLADKPKDEDTEDRPLKKINN